MHIAIYATYVHGLLLRGRTSIICQCEHRQLIIMLGVIKSMYYVAKHVDYV